VTEQVTSFKCGGMALGFTWAHLIGDIPSAAACFSTWAQLFSGKKAPAPTLRDPLAMPPSAAPPASVAASPGPRISSRDLLLPAPVLGFRGPSGELIVTAHQKILRYIDKIYLYTGLSSGTTLLEAKKNLCKATSCDLTNCSSYLFCFLFVVPDKYFLGNILNF
jgi:hypothetical protein